MVATVTVRQRLALEKTPSKGFSRLLPKRDCGCRNPELRVCMREEQKMVRRTIGVIGPNGIHRKKLPDLFDT